MSFGGFILGIALMAVGFAAVAKTDVFLRNLGDVGQMFGFFGASWLSWKVVGIILMVLGFLVGTGLFTLFLKVTIGQVFLFGEL